MMRVPCGIDRIVDMPGVGLVDLTENVLRVVRHDRLVHVTAAHIAAPDDHRDVDPLVVHLLETRLEASSFRRTGAVVLHRLVPCFGRLQHREVAHFRPRFVTELPIKLRARPEPAPENAPWRPGSRSGTQRAPRIARALGSPASWSPRER